jgi:hypothetical protein
MSEHTRHRRRIIMVDSISYFLAFTLLLPNY